MNKMPLYQSHKKVHALEIKDVIFNEDFDLQITYCNAGYEHIIFKVPSEMRVRYQPKSGDYHVFYEDGYASFSPRKAFIEGHTKVN